MGRLTVGGRVISEQHDRGEAMHRLIEDLFPLPRSITGPGLRATVCRLAEVVPLDIMEVPTGTRVFDWAIPEEWSIEDAYIEDDQGLRVVDFGKSSLHVVGYSVPVEETLSFSDLRPHLHSLPDHPDWIPYRTSYYTRDWGFCLADRVLKQLNEGSYHAVIRSTLAPGSLTLAEHYHRGETDKEVLIFAHDCHPSLANDNLSGVVVAAHLAAWLRNERTRYSYRFVFAPATIGSIAWLALNESHLGRVCAGLVLSLLGSESPFHYKMSRHGGRLIDRAAWHVLRTEYRDSRRLDFLPWGYDERQFCSPGIDLPMGRLTRVPNGEFPEYHTSADDLSFVTARALGEAWVACLKIIEAIENDDTFVNMAPKGEPQLGRRGLYRAQGGYQDIPERQLALLWVLNQSDGRASLLEIAERSGLPFRVILDAAQDLVQVGLLEGRASREGL